ncbi:MAG: hypothetical protein IKM43_00510 [Clostridia bacterium]|nr:hypothetical protein [Clostridia bacterium]
MKKLSAILLCLLMIVTCGLAGCATFSINKVKYYNETLATVGNTHITRFDLLNAYNNYGYNYYVSQMGQSEEQALNSTLDLLIDREVLFQYAQSKPEFKPKAYQVNQVVEEMFTSLDERMSTLVEDAKNILNLKSEDKEDKTKEKDETLYTITDYKYESRRRATLETKYIYYNADGSLSSTPTDDFEIEYYIQYVPEVVEAYDPIIKSEFLSDFTNSGIVEELYNTYLTRFRNSLKDEKVENIQAIYNKAISLFAEDLIDYEYYLRDANGKEFSKTTKDLMMRYFERTFNNNIKSQYLENVRIDYLNEPNTLSTSALVEKYQKMVTINHNQYKNRQNAYKTKMKDIGTKGDTVLYHPTLKDGTQFGYFIHTLLSFSSTQQSEIKALDKKDPFYNDDYSEIVGKTMVAKRDASGKEVAKVTLSEVLEDYTTRFSPADDFDTKLDKFIDFMFTYTGDTATMSAGMPYVVGTNGNSAMEQAFTDESIKLMETNNIGAMSTVNLQELNYSDLCVTSYGIHLVFFVGDVNSFDISFDKTDDIKINDLTKTLNPLTDETYFDMLFDEVYPASGSEENYTSNNGYTKYEESLIALASNSYPIVRYTSKIKGTTTQL